MRDRGAQEQIRCANLKPSISDPAEQGTWRAHVTDPQRSYHVRSIAHIGTSKNSQTNAGGGDSKEAVLRYSSAEISLLKPISTRKTSRIVASKLLHTEHIPSLHQYILQKSTHLSISPPTTDPRSSDVKEGIEFQVAGSFIPVETTRCMKNSQRNRRGAKACDQGFVTPIHQVLLGEGGFRNGGEFLRQPRKNILERK